MKRFKEQAAAHLAPVARTGHLAYFVGVFVEGHGSSTGSTSTSPTSTL